jgi:predicted phosphodiesterase
MLFLRKKDSRLSTLVTWVSLVLATLVVLALIAAFVALRIVGTSVTEPVPAFTLLDPSKGIAPRASSSAGADEKPYLRLAVSSDPHWGKEASSVENRSSILATVASGNYDALFILGDLTEMGIIESQMREAATDFARMAPRLPIRPLMGNHDAIVGGQDHYNGYFFPKTVSSASGSPWYWRVDSGTTHIIALNLLWGTESFDSAQRTWLERELKSIPREETVIVMSHCYFWASGFPDSETGVPWYDHPETTAELPALFEANGVDLVISGHNHYMELLKKNGVSYAVIGTMGGKLDPVPSHVSPWSRWFKQGSFGFLDLSAFDGRLELIFRDQKGAELSRHTVKTSD